MPHTIQEIAQKTLDIIPFVMQVMASEMRGTGHAVASGHLRLLGILSQRTYTLTELAELSSVTPPTMSNTITALENRGWVTRTRSKEDRRVVLIELTTEGKHVLNDIEEKTRDRISELIADLPPDEKQVLLSGLNILKRAFEVTLHQRHTSLTHYVMQSQE